MGCEIEPRVRLLEEALGHETVEHLGAEDNVQLPEPNAGQLSGAIPAFPGTASSRAISASDGSVVRPFVLVA